MIGRYVRLTAQPGHGEELGGLLVSVAESVRGTPGCRLYVINRATDDPDVIWVTELWDSQEAVDESLRVLQTEAGRTRLAEVMGHVAGPPERTDLIPLGGVGLDG
jgi:quinol monooxygenase YgiN